MTSSTVAEISANTNKPNHAERGFVVSGMLAFTLAGILLAVLAVIAYGVYFPSDSEADAPLNVQQLMAEIEALMSEPQDDSATTATAISVTEGQSQSLRIAELEFQNEDQSARIVELEMESENKSLRIAELELESESQNNSSGIAELESELESQNNSSRIAELEAENDALALAVERTLDDLAAEITLREQVESESRALNQATSAPSSQAESNNTELQRQISELEEENAQISELLAQAELEISQQDESSQINQAEQLAAADERERLNTENAELAAQIASMESDIGELTSDLGGPLYVKSSDIELEYCESGRQVRNDICVDAIKTLFSFSKSTGQELRLVISRPSGRSFITHRFDSALSNNFIFRNEDPLLDPGEYELEISAGGDTLYTSAINIE